MVRVIALVLVLIAAPAFAQTPEQIVGRQRAKFGATVSPTEAPALLKAIAIDLTQTLGTPYGLLPKAAGNQCGGYACDIICNAGFHWDVLADGPDSTTTPPYSGAARPGWNADGPVPRACELVAAPSAPPIPAPTPGQGPAPVQSLDLTPILARLAAIEEQNERIYADSNNRRDAQTAELKAAIDSPGWFSKVFGNTYVQLALASFTTYYATHQAMK